MYQLGVSGAFRIAHLYPLIITAEIDVHLGSDTRGPVYLFLGRSCLKCQFHVVCCWASHTFQDHEADGFTKL